MGTYIYGLPSKTVTLIWVNIEKKREKIEIKNHSSVVLVAVGEFLKVY